MEGTPTGLHMSMMNEGENEIEEMEEEEDDGDDVEPMLPLSVEMEGKNRMLTVAILSFTALAMSLHSGGGAIEQASEIAVKYLEDRYDYTLPLHRIFNLLIWIMELSVYSLGIMWAMQVNIKPFKKGWRRHRACSCLGLLLWDLFVLPVFTFSVAFEEVEKDNGSTSNRLSIFPMDTPYMVCMGVFFIAVNFGFIFLPFFWQHESENRPMDELATGIVIEELATGGGEVHVHDESLSLRCKEVVAEQHNDQAVEKGVQLAIKGGSDHPSSLLDHWNTAIFTEHLTKNQISVAFTKSQDGSGPKEIGPIKKVSLKWACELHQLWVNVREEGNDFNYSVWMITAAFVSVVLLVVGMLISIEWFQSLALKVQLDAENALRIQSREERTEPHANGPRHSALAAVNNAEQFLSELLANDILPERKAEVLQIAQQLAGLKIIPLSEATWLESLTKILDEQTGLNLAAAPQYFVDYCKVLRITSVVGFVISTVVGLHAVYVNLATHKSMGMQLTKELRSYQGGHGSGIEDMYPIGKAVYLLGVMTSTALAQQAILGGLISLLLGVVFNYKGYSAFMHFCGYWLLVVILTIVFNRLIVLFVGNRLHSDGFRIKNPRGFLFYMCIFSMLHFVLGVYYAAIRISWLLITTIFTISRLDITLFSSGRKLDNGHNAYMATLLLTGVIHGNIRQMRSDTEDSEVSSEDYEPAELASDITTEAEAQGNSRNNSSET